MRRYATPGEAATLLAVLPRADKAIWGTALYAGLRRGELMGLRTSDVDVATGLIRVEQAYDARSKKIIPPKSYAGRRKVPIAGLLRSPLVDARARASERGLELVFGRKSGQPFSYDGILDRAKRIWNLHGLEPIGLHECRHTFASLTIAAMSDAGRFNPKVLQPLMGHASITETYDRYGHLMPGSENEAAGMLDRLPRSGRRRGPRDRRKDWSREKCGKNLGGAGRSFSSPRRRGRNRWRTAERATRGNA